MSRRAPFILLAGLGIGCASCPRTGAAPTPAPTAQSATSQTDAGLEVKVDADGRAYIGSAPVYRSEDFAHAVAEARKTHPTDFATIYADAEVPHGRVVAVQRELEQAGIVHVAFALAGEPHPAEPVVPPPPKPALATPPPAPSEPKVSPAEPPPESLPQVKVDNVGLHIGGGPNDDASKRPFLDAIEKHFEEFRACYVKVEQPEKGGTFGVDMRIGREGGRAKVEQPRTGMKGNEFRECVQGVFKNIEFGRPAKGPTVISYSLRFTLEK